MSSISKYIKFFDPYVLRIDINYKSIILKWIINWVKSIHFMIIISLFLVKRKHLNLWHLLLFLQVRIKTRMVNGPCEVWYKEYLNYVK